jgi:DNA modification methylase
MIRTASNEGDTVLDPFVGGGTTVAVADKLGRKWIGIDQSVAAIEVTKQRLKQLTFSLFNEHQA